MFTHVHAFCWRRVGHIWRDGEPKFDNEPIKQFVEGLVRFHRLFPGQIG